MGALPGFGVQGHRGLRSRRGKDRRADVERKVNFQRIGFSMPHIRMLFAIGFFTALGANNGAAQEKKVEMVPVKYAGLKQEILKQRGKVVLVDFWAGD